MQRRPPLSSALRAAAPGQLHRCRRHMRVQSDRRAPRGTIIAPAPELDTSTVRPARIARATRSTSPEARRSLRVLVVALLVHCYHALARAAIVASRLGSARILAVGLLAATAARAHHSRRLDSSLRNHLTAPAVRARGMVSPTSPRPRPAPFRVARRLKRPLRKSITSCRV